MNANLETQRVKYQSEIVKWLIVAVLLIIAIIGNYFYHDSLLPLLRLIILSILVVVAGGIALLTNKVKHTITIVIQFIRETHIEIHKVIWPTYQEALSTTLVVMIVTILVSLVLWGLDNILIRLISFITKLRF